MFLDDIVSGIGNAIGGAVEGIADLAGGAGSVLAGGASSLIQGVLNPLGLVDNVFDMATSFADNFLPSVVPGFELLSPIPELAEGIFGVAGQMVHPIPIAPQPPMPSMPDLNFSGGGIAAILSALAAKADGQLGELKELAAGYDPSAEDAQQQMINIQTAMQNYTQITNMVTSMSKDLHDMNMAIIRNLKG